MSARTRLAISAAVAMIAVPLGGFVLGFMGHIGSLHHATHVAGTMAGVELLVCGFIAILYVAYLAEEEL